MGLYKLLSSVRFVQRGVYSIAKRTNSCVAEQSSGEGENSEDQLDSNKKGLVLGVYEKNNKFELTPASEEVDKKTEGKLSKHLNGLSSQLKLGKAFVVTDLLPEYAAVALTSLGPKDPGYNNLEALDETRENVRWGVGAGVRALAARGCGAVAAEGGAAPDAAAEAAHLAAWRFQEFKCCDGKKPQSRVSLYGSAGAELWDEGAIRGEAQNWARYLSDMPANMMTPVDLAQAALDELCPLGVRVEARDRDWISAQRMAAFLSVARGSCAAPVFLECVYSGASTDRPPVLIAAKGVTFDSGGLCLKRPESMVENRGSMAGAAVVLAALKIIALLKVPINVCAVIPICENMVSGQCMKVGDVVRALNGLSIQIEDTDLEGRLMMADALVYGQAVHKPSLVIDVATLTHDPSVDLRNKGSGKATPCLGAAFLRNFVCCDWVHMDITGVGKVAHAAAPPYLHPRRMTGRPARTLAALLADVAAATPATPADKT